MHPSCSQPEHTRSACAQRGFTATHPNLLSSKGFPLDLLSANPQCWGWRPGPCICLTSATTERCAPLLVAFDNPGSCPGQGRCLLYTVFDIRHRSPRWKAELSWRPQEPQLSFFPSKDKVGCPCTYLLGAPGLGWLLTPSLRFITQLRLGSMLSAVFWGHHCQLSPGCLPPAVEQAEALDSTSFLLPPLTGGRSFAWRPHPALCKYSPAVLRC